MNEVSLNLMTVFDKALLNHLNTEGKNIDFRVTRNLNDFFIGDLENPIGFSVEVEINGDLREEESFKDLNEN